MVALRPLVGVMCCNEFATRPIQAVATRFIRPLTDIAKASVLLIPAVSEAIDAVSLAGTLDGLLLTGSRSHIAPSRYGSVPIEDDPIDTPRDEVALRLSSAMVERGKPVFGICRGMQEINVLFGGTLSREGCRDRHLKGSWDDQTALLNHRHEVALAPGGLLATNLGAERILVNSAHEQGVARLGRGLAIEAVAPEDGLVEAVAAPGLNATVLAVQWHPECDLGSTAGVGFFALLGGSLHGVGFASADKVDQHA